MPKAPLNSFTKPGASQAKPSPSEGDRHPPSRFAPFGRATARRKGAVPGSMCQWPVPPSTTRWPSRRWPSRSSKKTASGVTLPNASFARRRIPIRAEPVEQWPGDDRARDGAAHSDRGFRRGGSEEERAFRLGGALGLGSPSGWTALGVRHAGFDAFSDEPDVYGIGCQQTG